MATYTLKDFIEESLGVRVRVEGLPDEIKPMEAAQRFASHEDIEIHDPAGDSRANGRTPFDGWFPKSIKTKDDEHLFTLTVQSWPNGYNLQVHEAALQYLEPNQSA